MIHPLVCLKDQFGCFVLLCCVLAVGTLTDSDSSERGACSSVLNHRLACGLSFDFGLSAVRNMSKHFMSWCLFDFDRRLIKSFFTLRFPDNFMILWTICFGRFIRDLMCKLLSWLMLFNPLLNVFYCLWLIRVKNN